MIDGYDFYGIEAEKYWGFPKNYKKDAKAETREMILSNKYLGSIKKDGYYYRYINENGEPSLLSRNISKVTGTFLDKISHVPHIKSLLGHLPVGTVLLGEVFFQDISKTSSDVTKIMGCLPEKAVKRQEDGPKLSYYIFDVLAYDGKSFMKKTAKERFEWLEYHIAPIFKDCKHIVCAKYAAGQDLLDMTEQALESGEEGVVITLKDSYPEPGKRTTRKTLKIKKELAYDLDVFFTGRYKEPTFEYNGDALESWKYWREKETEEFLPEGEHFPRYFTKSDIEPVSKMFYYGWAAAAEIGVLKDGEIHVVGYISGINEDIKQGLVENNPRYRLRPCIVSAMQFTEDNKLRHPVFYRFRSDIDYTDCTYDKIFQE